MSTRRSLAAWQTRRIRLEIGTQIHDARLSAGVGQKTAGQAFDMSHSEFGRIERAALPNVTVEQLSRACAAVGLKLVVNAYPDGDPVRDRAHLALIGRLEARIATPLQIRTEVVMPLHGDRRAWDAVIAGPDGSIAVEAETRIRDVQALERRIGLKLRDGGLDRVILLVNATAANRRVMALHGTDLHRSFPRSGREILKTLSAGVIPSASGLLLL